MSLGQSGLRRVVRGKPPLDSPRGSVVHLPCAVSDLPHLVVGIKWILVIVLGLHARRVTGLPNSCWDSPGERRGYFSARPFPVTAGYFEGSCLGGFLASLPEVEGVCLVPRWLWAIVRVLKYRTSFRSLADSGHSQGPACGGQGSDRYILCALGGFCFGVPRCLYFISCSCAREGICSCWARCLRFLFGQCRTLSLWWICFPFRGRGIPAGEGLCSLSLQGFGFWLCIGSRRFTPPWGEALAGSCITYVGQAAMGSGSMGIRPSLISCVPAFRQS